MTALNKQKTQERAKLQDERKEQQAKKLEIVKEKIATEKVAAESAAAASATTVEQLKMSQELLVSMKQAEENLIVSLSRAIVLRLLLNEWLLF